MGHMELPFWGEGEVVGGQRWHYSKERWRFPCWSRWWRYNDDSDA